MKEAGRRPRGLSWCSVCPEGTGWSQEPIRKVEWTGPGDRLDVGHEGMAGTRK